ncbi:MAG TPA: Sec-independent protein translocase protein TatB [Hyphomicrobiaceae bacterium]|nr:Sec-independent protein translocase protein TatB [Hyphomicrobiaceae bacterium]
MLDIGGMELLVIAIVALLVVGPKELPGLLRTIGRFVGAIKRQAQEFRAQFDEAIRDSELDELRKSVNEIKSEAEAGARNLTDVVEKEVSDVKKVGDDLAGDINDPSKKDLDDDWLVEYERSIEEAKKGPVDEASGDDPGAVADTKAVSDEAAAKPVAGQAAAPEDGTVKPAKIAGAAT